jgi:hypothetical protein
VAGQRSKVKKKRGIGLKVISGEGLKVKGHKLEVRGQKSRVKGQKNIIFQIHQNLD